MKNPNIFWTVLIVLLIAGILIGNSAWAKNIFKRNSENEGGNATPAPTEGSECDLPDGTKGQIVGGLCMPVGRPDDDIIERTSATTVNGNNNVEGIERPYAGTGEPTMATVPNIILIPYSADCRARYTQQTPYSYGGCSYVFVQNIQQKGVMYCQLRKISCP